MAALIRKRHLGLGPSLRELWSELSEEDKGLSQCDLLPLPAGFLMVLPCRHGQERTW